MKEDKIGEENEYDTALFCNKPQLQEFPYQGTSEADSHSKGHIRTTACNSNAVDIDKIIMQGIVKPSNPGVIHVPSFNYSIMYHPEFPEHLAYEVGEDFGREYKTWLQGDGRNKGAKSRVGFLYLANGYNLTSFLRLVSGLTCGTVIWAMQLIAEI